MAKGGTNPPKGRSDRPRQDNRQEDTTKGGYGMRRNDPYFDFPDEFKGYVALLSPEQQDAILNNNETRWQYWEAWKTGKPIKAGTSTSIPIPQDPLDPGTVADTNQVPGPVVDGISTTVGDPYAPPGVPAPTSPAAEITPAADNGPLIARLRFFLEEGGFKGDEIDQLIGLIKGWISAGLSEDEIMLELRASPIFKNAYPEIEMRQKGGFDDWSPATIRQYRDEARQLAKDIYGVDLSRDQIASLIGGDVSLSEFGHRLEVFSGVKRNGGEVQSVFEELYGVKLDDEDLSELFDPERNTKELDELYEDALYMGRPAILGLGRRSKDEADLLRKIGVTQEESFSRFETVAQRKAMFERLAGIQSGMTGNDFLNGEPLERLVKGIIFRDQATLDYLGNQIALEYARHNKGGGTTGARSLLARGAK